VYTHTGRVRIIAHGLQSEYNDIAPVYCHWLNGDTWMFMGACATPVQASGLGRAHYTRHYPSTMHHDEWVASYVFCALPPHEVAVARRARPDLVVALGAQACVPRTQLRVQRGTFTDVDDEVR
jgi:hypothetical protein